MVGAYNKRILGAINEKSKSGYCPYNYVRTSGLVYLWVSIFFRYVKERMVVAKNEITGDNLISKKNSTAYEDNYDNIFRNKKDALCEVCGKVLGATKECAWTSCPLNWDEKRVDIIGQNGPTGEHYKEST